MGCCDNLLSCCQRWAPVLIIVALFLLDLVENYLIRLTQTVRLWNALAYGHVTIGPNGTAAYEKLIFG